MASALSEAQALLHSGPQQAGPAVLRLKAAAETSETVELLLLLVKACLMQGGEEVLTAVNKAKRAVDASKQEGSEVQALALLHLGVAYHEAASQMRLLSRKMKVRYNEEALVVLEMAAQLQPSNFFCVFNLARIQAHARAITGALKNARTALSVASTEKGAPKWALLVLVLTSRKEFKVALSIIEVGLLEVEPQEQVLLLRIKARVHQIQDEPELALESLAKAQARAASDDGDLWLSIGEAFLKSKSVADAEACRDLAVQSKGSCAPVLCLNAHIHQVKGEWKEALQCCQDAQALATHLPAGADAFFRMGMLYYERDMGLEDKYFAIGLFSDAIRTRPTMEEAWRHKGLIYQGLEQKYDAKECLDEADKLFQSQPALPFSELSYCL